ncbi:MAG: hypothetical protein M1480_18480 [Bacteroidetes bacterium]|nr:hypothetical protein [Bacteroidota bacterium]
MNKTFAVILGLIAGLIAVLYLNELVKAFSAFLLIKQNVSIAFYGIKLTVSFPFSKSNSSYIYLLVMITPFIANVLFIETAFIWLSKTASDHIRTSLIIFQLINIGYLIFAAFIGIISIILNSSVSTEWTTLLNQENLSYNQKLIFMLFILILLLGYINILTKRIKKSIPAIGRK